ncbi:heptaprenyl diphosphate synthase component II [Alkalicoccus daliensis]|uniref:Heptaprenyl diphosphate synthase n=1 Tax=Alkalicoccus daliensis TaxID=745820 RepID=A0A1H0AVC5_9BACI|nr:heptaprenyl diphosphate synthase component II [Alkalicoccus daliensis]SDN37427.1 heptaprenyl diphosphate synthase [Alkalicoccus daliensis]
MKLAEIYRHLRPDILQIEKEIELQVQAEHPQLREASTHILKAGGKRIRPIFVLLSAQYGDYDLNEIKKVAVPLELIHMASLVHDDVIDNADLRRGKKTIKSKWDNRVAMYTGDYIFAKATEIATKSKYPQVHSILAKAMQEMCIGEIEQIQDQYQLDQHVKQYLRRIRRKTALLISVSCELGALVSGTSAKTQHALKMYGYYVGMAFQITDDILDFVGSERELGKPAGSDLAQGNVTYPAIYAMSKDREFYQKMQEFAAEPSRYPLQVDDAIQSIKNSGAVEASKDLANKYVNKANKMLYSIEEKEPAASLEKIAQYIGNRKY